MPVRKVDGGWQWGNHGKVYPTKEEAEEQEQAAYANGYTGDSALATLVTPLWHSTEQRCAPLTRMGVCTSN